MNNSITIVFYNLIFIFFVSASLFLFTVLRRIYIHRQDILFERLYLKIEGDIFKALSSPTPDDAIQLVSKHIKSRNALVRVLVNCIERIEGREKNYLKIAFNTLLKEKYVKDLSSTRMTKRLKAIRLLGFFSGPSEIPYLINRLNDRPIVRLAAVSALSRIETQEAVAPIFEVFEKDTHPNIRSYLNIMLKLGNKTEELIKACLKKQLSERKICLLIELVGLGSFHSLYRDIIVFSNHHDKEIRIRVARALGRLLIPESLDILIKLASDEAWEVRGQAIKSLGQLKSQKALDILTESMFSPFWHIRYNAAHSLAYMGICGIRQLREVSIQKRDRYASDMATMVLDDIVCLEETDA